MSDVRERLKKVRNNHPKGRTQKEFADFLGIPFSNLTSYEAGRRGLSQAVIHLIAQKCNVNEKWLSDGVGDMYVEVTREQEIAQIVSTLYKEDDPFKTTLIKMIADMDERQISLLKDMAKKLVDSMNEE